MNNLNIGIIGFGKMGQIREKAIKKKKIGKIIAISDPNQNSEYVNLSHDEIINHKEIDTIFICTPNYLNKELTIKSLKANKNVFCEKPPAFSEEEVNEIIKEEEFYGKHLMYGFNHRHHDSIKKIKNLIDSNEFGKVLWARGRYGKSVTKDFYNDWRSKKKLAGGGILLDQGIHMLDLFIYLCGDYDVVKSEISNLYWNMDVEDNAFVILKNSNSGQVASLHSTMTQWRHLFSLEIFLEKGYFVLNGLLTSSKTYGKEVLSIAKNRSTSPAATWEDEIKLEFEVDTSWDNEVEYFSNSIQANKPIEIGNSYDAKKLMKIIDKVYNNG